MMTDEQKLNLYKSQCETLKTLLEHNAISYEQYLTSFNGLTEKTGMQRYADEFKVKREKQ